MSVDKNNDDLPTKSSMVLNLKAKLQADTYERPGMVM